MKKRKLKKFEKLNQEFLDDCERVIRYLAKVHDACGFCYDNAYFADKYKLLYDHTLVEWSGIEYGGSRGLVYHSGWFEKELLTYTDEQLEEWANEEIKWHIEMYETHMKDNGLGEHFEKSPLYKELCKEWRSGHKKGFRGFE